MKQPYLRSVFWFILPATTLLFAGCNDFWTKDISLGVKDDSGDGGDGTPTDRPTDDDGDGISNEVEESFGMDPRSADTDHDGFGDGLELVNRVGDPLDGSKVPARLRRVRILTSETGGGPDGDGDGIADDVESELALDPETPFSDDDGYADGLELLGESNPLDSSSRPSRSSAPQSDGITHTDPPPADTDEDGIADFLETDFGTDSNDADSDTDGFSDGLEFGAGSDQLDPLSVPAFETPEPPTSTSTSSTTSTTIDENLSF